MKIEFLAGTFADILEHGIPMGGWSEELRLRPLSPAGAGIWAELGNRSATIGQLLAKFGSCYTKCNIWGKLSPWGPPRWCTILRAGPKY